MRLSLRFLLVATLPLIGASGCSERSGDTGRTTYLVKAGIMEPADAMGDRLRETLTITMDPARTPGWCFLVDPPDDETYEVYSIAYLPGQPKQLTGDFAGQSDISAGLRSATSRGDGIRPFCFDFDPGDPLGEYRIEVYINGTLHSELHLQVVALAVAERSI